MRYGPGCDMDINASAGRTALKQHCLWGRQAVQSNQRGNGLPIERCDSYIHAALIDIVAAVKEMLRPVCLLERLDMLAKTGHGLLIVQILAGLEYSTVWSCRGTNSDHVPTSDRRIAA